MEGLGPRPGFVRSDFVVEGLERVDAEFRQSLFRTVRPGLPMTRQVECYHSVIPTERLKLGVPEAAVGQATVNEDQGRLPHPAR